MDGFGFIFEFRRLYERPLEVHVVALEINFGAVEDYFRRSVGISWGFDLNFRDLRCQVWRGDGQKWVSCVDVAEKWTNRW